MSFETELRELIARHRHRIGVMLEDIIEDLDTLTEELVEEVNARVHD